MENAVDALKLAFAVFVFAIAVALSFNVIGQVRQTSDIVMQINDKTSSYDYIEESNTDLNSKERIVGFETILPTIYRYAEEQYAVSIYDNNGTPIARFDLWTEGFMGNWDQVLKNKDKLHNEEAKKTYNNIQQRLNLVQNEVYKVTNQNKEFNMNWLGSLYAVTAHNNRNGIHHGAPWVGNSRRNYKKNKL